MASRRLLVLAAAALLLLAAPAAAKSVRFKFSVAGTQTASWNQTLQSSGGACAPTEGGKQTIGITTTKPGKLRIKHLVSGRFKANYGTGDVQTNWSFTRDFASTCPPPPPYDCGKQGPFGVPMNLSYRTGEFTLSGVLNGVNGRGPSYRTCGYEGYHEQDVEDALRRLSAKKLFNPRRKVFHLTLKAHRVETLADTGGKQTTDVHANLTLRRIR